jgi:hypothetical protein
MGLESGNEEGLKTLHKQITVDQNLRAVEILKEIGLVFEYGFMLFASIQHLRGRPSEHSFPTSDRWRRLHRGNLLPNAAL